MTLNPPTPSAPIRDEKGRLLPGHGMGRPRGSKNVFAADTMRQIKELTPDAITALGKQITRGNMQAIAFVLERVIGRNRMVELDGDKPTDITNALIAGEISTEEALQIATVVEKLMRVEELDAVLNRMDALEKLLRGN